MTDRSFTPSDKDYIVRTVIGEAANEPDEGLAAVAHVILNRMNAGKYGNSARSVVLAPNQFEPWSTRREELLGYAPTDPAYVKASKIVEDVIGGKFKDPTEGATHFLQEEIVRQRRGGTLPNWAQGGTKKIGAHTFFKPGDEAWGERTQTASLIDKYSRQPGADFQAMAREEPAPLAEGLSLIERYTKQPKPPESESRIPVPDETMVTTEKNFSSLSNAAREVAAIPGRFGTSMVDHAAGGSRLIQQGLSEIGQGVMLPHGDIRYPSTWSPGGFLRTTGGVLQGVLSPLTAATETLVEEPVARFAGERAGKTAGLISNVLPSSLLARGANRLRPTVRAQEKVGDVPLSGEELTRLQSNPRLTPMDVNPTLRQAGMGLYTEPGAAKNLIHSRVQRRVEEAPEAVSEAYSAAAGPVPNVIELMKSYKKTASDNAAKGFGEAFKDIKPIDLGPVVDKIEKALYPHVGGKRISESQLAHGQLEYEIQKVGQKLYDEGGMVTDPQRLHEIQSELGRTIRNLSRSASGADQNVARGLKPLHNTLVKVIDDAADGKYQPARLQYRSDKEVDEAFDRGVEILQNRKNKAGLLEDTPDAWRAWVKDATKEELEAARLGARSIIEQHIMGYRHSARRGTDLTDVPYNREKFEALFGKQEADRLARLMRDERDIAETNQKLIHNSATAERLAGREMVKVRDKDAPLDWRALGVPAAEYAGTLMGAPSGVGGALALGGIAAKFVGNRLARRSDIARNTEMADIISRGGPEGMRGLQQSMRAVGDRNRLRPVPPVTYVPPEKRERRLVPVKSE